MLKKKVSDMRPRHAKSTTVARPVAPVSKTAQRPVEKPVDFAIHLPQASAVTLAGTFNGWDASRTPMHKGQDGYWTVTVWLPPGCYEYRFVADGQWLSDPNAKESVANDFGSTNSVVIA
jgi:1,4-alpha-glucan branching enzyme